MTNPAESPANATSAQSLDESVSANLFRLARLTFAGRANGASLLASQSCIGLADVAAETWIEAKRGSAVIKFLKTEWIPYAGLGDRSETLDVDGQVQPGEPSSDEFAEMLQEWLSRKWTFDMPAVSIPPM